MRLIDSDKLIIKPDYIHDICGMAMIRLEDVVRIINEMPTIDLQPQQIPCATCESLENGDTLYSMSDWDGGIGFDYIRDIKYCPVCGKRLDTRKEK